jgi:large subunit ribosomal protein L15
VNLEDLERVQSGRIGPDELRAARLISGRAPLVKILAGGEISRGVTVRAHAVSAAARAKIENAGGSVELIPIPQKARRK